MRHIHRMAAKRRAVPDEAILYGYLSKLYTSLRHRHLDAAYRHAVVLHVLQYYAGPSALTEVCVLCC